MKEQKIVYEVLRIINGKPLFGNDHFDRMSKSIGSVFAGQTLSEKTFFDGITQVVENEHITNGNIEITVTNEASGLVLKAFPIPYHYPSAQEYAAGVPVQLLQHVRNDPHDKVQCSQHRAYVDAIIARQHVFELLYYDNDNCVSEGTRSNFFFIQHNTLLSPPSAKILLGTTRLHVLNCARRIGMHYREDNIPVNKLGDFEAAFLSGTSPKILPVRSIEGVVYDVNNSKLRRLMAEFDIEAGL